MDSQFYNPHLIQFGAYEISDEDYQNKLRVALTKKRKFPSKITYLESLSFDPVSFLIMPRVLAAAFMFPILVIVADFCGINTFLLT